MAKILKSGSDYCAVSGRYMLTFSLGDAECNDLGAVERAVDALLRGTDPEMLRSLLDGMGRVRKLADQDMYLGLVIKDEFGDTVRDDYGNELVIELKRVRELRDEELAEMAVRELVED